MKFSSDFEWCLKSSPVFKWKKVCFYHTKPDWSTIQKQQSLVIECLVFRSPLCLVCFSDFHYTFVRFLWSGNFSLVQTYLTLPLMYNLLVSTKDHFTFNKLHPKITLEMLYLGVFCCPKLNPCLQFILGFISEMSYINMFYIKG